MKKTLCLMLVAFGILTATISRADIFGPQPAKKFNANLTISSSDSSTILDEVTKIAEYLGPREGFAYDFRRKEFVNYAAATLYTYQPYGISLDFGQSMLMA